SLGRAGPSAGCGPRIQSAKALSRWAANRSCSRHPPSCNPLHFLPLDPIQGGQIGRVGDCAFDQEVAEIDFLARVVVALPQAADAVALPFAEILERSFTSSEPFKVFAFVIDEGDAR